MTDDLSQFSVDHLLDRCAEQATKKSEIREDQYCFELVRRAFLAWDEFALKHVLHMYRTVWSKHWIRNPHELDTHPQTAEDFKNIAFNKVNENFIRQKKTMADFPDLSRFLGYLKTILSHEVGAYYRKREVREFRLRKTKTDDGDDTEKMDQIPAGDDSSQEVERKQIWQKIDERVKALLKNDADQILFNCWIKLDLSHDEILQHYSHLWHNKNDIRVARQRIQRKLERDRDFLELLKDLRERR